MIPVTCSPPRSLDGEDVIAVLRSGARRADRTSLQRRSAPKPFGDPCRRWMKLTSTRELIMVLDKDLSLRHDSPPPRVMLRCGFLLQHLGGFWAVAIALNASAASTGGDGRWPLPLDLGHYPGYSWGTVGVRVGYGWGTGGVRPPADFPEWGTVGVQVGYRWGTLGNFR